MSQFSVYIYTNTHREKNIRRVSVKTLTVNFPGWWNHMQFFSFFWSFISFSSYISIITIHYFCHQKSKRKMFRNLEL